MIVEEYEAIFYELARHVTLILSTEYERIQRFIKGLILSLYIVAHSLVAMGKSFIDITDYVYTMKGLYCEAHEGIIRGLTIRIAIVRVIVVLSLGVEGFRISILSNNRISNRVNLEGSATYFRKGLS